MPCYSPLRAWKGPLHPKTGKRQMVFRWKDAAAPTEYKLPCGRCVGCRLEYSRQWAVRMMHEAQLHDENCFITLTYDDDHLPSNKSLNKEHFQKFIKRLRERYKKYTIKDESGNVVEPGIRFYHCGEYGEQFGRPHYHAILFNHWFEDQEPWKQNVQGDMLFTSRALSELWPFGFSSVGAATFETAAYCARYVMKKVGNPRNTTRIYICPETGHVWPIAHEYVTMSRGQAIGSGWYHKYGDHMRSHGFVVMNGVKMKPPRLYDDLFEHEYPSDARRYKLRRRVAMLEGDPRERMSSRLCVKEDVKLAQLTRLSRPL